MRVVLDVNVLVAGLTARGFCAEVVEAVLAGHTLLVDGPLVADVTRVLAQKFRVPSDRVADVRAHLCLRGETVQSVPLVGAVCRDPDDDRILALAVTGKADAIVTGDDDLLVLSEHDSIPILRPREFWSWAASRKTTRPDRAVRSAENTPEGTRKDD